LVENLRPRAAFGGHSHYGCRKWWKAPDNFWEYTVASLSWRNNHRPSFLLVSISPKEMLVGTCLLPDEYLVISLYVVFSVVLILVPILGTLICRRVSHAKIN